MRFIGDPAVSGPQEVAIGNYIIQKGIAYPELRDEIYSQLACQTCSSNDEGSERGWLLMALCLCVFLPSPVLYKYLLKLVLLCVCYGICLSAVFVCLFIGLFSRLFVC